MNHPAVIVDGRQYLHEGSAGSGAECFRSDDNTTSLLRPTVSRVVLIWDRPLWPFPTRIFHVGTRQEAIGKAGAGKFTVCGECHGMYFI